MLLSLLHGATLAVSISVRYGETNLVPPTPLPLGGYTSRAERPFEPGGDTLKAKAIVLERQGVRIALVSAEMLTIPESLKRAVEQRLPSNLKLLLCATHSHCAPDSQMLNERMTFKVPGIATFRREWMEWYADRIAESVHAALRGPAVAEWDIVVETWHARLNRARRAGAMPDTAAAEIRFAGSSPDPVAAVWYAAHPVFFGPEETRLRSDYPGAIATGRRMFLPGAIGDVSPSAPGDTQEQRLKSFAQAFDASREAARRRRTLFESGPADGRRLSADPLFWQSENIELDRVEPHPGFAKANRVPELLAGMAVGLFAPQEAYVTAIRIGKAAIVGIPGEPTAALGRRIRDAGRRIGFEFVFVLSHVNGWIGYILEPEDYDRGEYEATLSFHGRLTGEKVADAAERALRKLAYPGGKGIRAENGLRQRGSRALASNSPISRKTEECPP